MSRALAISVLQAVKDLGPVTPTRIGERLSAERVVVRAWLDTYEKAGFIHGRDEKRKPGQKGPLQREYWVACLCCEPDEGATS